MLPVNKKEESSENIYLATLTEQYIFMLRISNISFYASKNLFLSFNGPFCPISHNEILKSFAGAWRFTVRLFLFNPLFIKRLRDFVFIPIRLIKQANAEGWSRSLGYFVRMKALYVNNTHYRYNLRSLAKRLNCSHGCLSYHIRELKVRGLLTDHSGNMTFNGFKKLGKIWGHKAVGVPVDHKNQLDLLRAQIIRFNLQQQEYNIKRSGVQQCQGYLEPDTLTERADSCYTGLSANGFGRLLKLSSAQGAAIRAKLIELGLLSFERRFCRLIASGGPSGGGPADGLREMKRQGLMPMHAFIRDGYIVTEKRMQLEYKRA